MNKASKKKRLSADEIAHMAERGEDIPDTSLTRYNKIPGQKGQCRFHCPYVERT